jgi:hypothetical protein
MCVVGIIPLIVMFVNIQSSLIQNEPEQPFSFSHKMSLNV